MKNGFKLADFGEDPSLWENSSGRPLFQKVEIFWRDPVPISKDGSVSPENESDDYHHGYLYAIIRNHGNQSTRDRIAYVGITNDLTTRFDNHKTAQDISAQRGETAISIGVIRTPGRRPSHSNLKLLREELEHILIWVLWPDLWNDKKTLVVPGQGRNGGKAWDIENSGFAFSGRMPRRVVFPWAAIVPRRNSTAR